MCMCGSTVCDGSGVEMNEKHTHLFSIFFMTRRKMVALFTFRNL